MANNFVDDAYMIYDLANHRYVLTEQALMEDKGIDIKAQFVTSQSDVDIPAFLKRVSLSLYSWLYRGVKDHARTEYVLSLSQFRNDIKEALEEEAMAMLTSRTDPSLFFSDKTSLHTVSPMVEQMTQESGIYYRGKWSDRLFPTGFYSTRGVDY